MSEAKSLLPCPVPWCGEAEQLSYIVSHWSGLACVECLTCKARGPFLPSKAEAIAAWNTRSDAYPALVEALEWARMQLEYLHCKFQAPDADRSALAKVEAALSLTHTPGDGQ